MANKVFRDWDLNQSYLLPPSLQDWLPEDHLVYRIIEVVNELDISSITSDIQSKDARGTRPYHPRMMLSLLIYAYSVGVRSSRKIEKATWEQVPFRVLTADQHPHFTVINDFRYRHRAAFVDLFVQAVRICRRAGLVSGEHWSLDGTKVNANASKHKAMSYGRMEQELEKTQEEIEALVAAAEKVDSSEDRELGEKGDPNELEEELKRREKRLTRIREAKEDLEEEARKSRAEELRRRAAEQESKVESEVDPVERRRKRTRARKASEQAKELDPGDSGEESGEELPRNRIPTTKESLPARRAQRNFTDPDSRIMKRDGAFLQAYNCQVLVDAKSQVIVAQAVTNQAPDQEHLIPLLRQGLVNADEGPTHFTADAGYIAAENIEFCEEQGIDAYIAVKRSRHGAGGLSVSDQPAEDSSWADMQKKLSTAKGKAIYARRKTIAEPTIGQIKEAMGFRRFSVRGINKVRSEWALISLCHNIRKLVRGDQVAPSPSRNHQAPFSQPLSPLRARLRCLLGVLANRIRSTRVRCSRGLCPTGS